MSSRRAGRGNATFRAMLRTWPVWGVVVLGAWLIWPAPIGTMSLGRDHVVHAARAWMVGQNLAHGHVSGWSSYWFFGFPLGELYPVVGDLAVALVRSASFGLLSWPACYALVFTAGYLLQGLALLRLSRATGLGPLPGVIAAALLYLDPGELNEGGWKYTVLYGVWLQPVSCALVWWAFAELHMALLPEKPRQPSRLVLVGVLVGLALLTHALAAPMIGLGALLFLLFVGLRGAVGRVFVATGLAIGLGICLAAWWFVPLYANRHWMASLGWLDGDLSAMLLSLVAGSWAAHMSPLVGYVILAGLLWAWLRGPRFAKFVATFAVLLWSIVASDLFFLFRLDWLSESFRLVHYRRFVLCAKPGLYLAAGALVVVLARWGIAAWRSDPGVGRRTLRATLGIAGALASLCAVSTGALIEARSGQVGELPAARVEGYEAFEHDWAAFNDWARARWEERDAFFRLAFKDDRNSHLFADSPVVSHAPSYKIGFTPGDDFVHKLESGQAAVLDRLRVRYVVGASAPRDAKVVKRFGQLKVAERPIQERVARLVGAGEMEVLRDDPDGAGVSVRLANVGQGERLEFNISGYSRWQALHDGVPIEWYEVPVTGTGRFATQAERRAGEFRANPPQGVPPSAPMLLAVDAQDGTYELRYRRWMTADVVGCAAFGLGLFACVLMLTRPAAAARALERARSTLRPRVLCAGAGLLLLALLARYGAGFRRESSLASGWLRVGRAEEVVGMQNGPLTIEHVIGPAVLAAARTGQPAQLVLPGVPSGERPIVGWVALDDVDYRGTAQGGLTLVVEGRPSGGGDFVQLLEQDVLLRTGKQTFTIPTDRVVDANTIDLRVTVRVAAGTAPRMGFDLEL
jgi:hypothetical protein